MASGFDWKERSRRIAREAKLFRDGTWNQRRETGHCYTCAAEIRTGMVHMEFDDPHLDSLARAYRVHCQPCYHLILRHADPFEAGRRAKQDEYRACVIRYAKIVGPVNLLVWAAVLPFGLLPQFLSAAAVDIGFVISIVALLAALITLPVASLWLGRSLVAWSRRRQRRR